MKPDFIAEALALSDRIIDLRRDIHAHPELGRNEKRTSALVRETLRSIGIDHIRECADTGVCADLIGDQPGPMIALRADMDALPVCEMTGLEYASVNEGVMHACGHDVHTSALLGAAMLLKAHKHELRGSVRFLFQPDEEGDGGAKRMIEDGALNGVSAIYGAHTAPELPCGSFGVRYGNAYAASNPFDLVIRGRGTHGAEPHLGTDAVVVACKVVDALQSIVSRNVSPLDSAVISIGSFHAGTARNIIADEAQLRGIIRCFGSESRKAMVEAVERAVRGICLSMNAEYELKFIWGYSGIINHDHETSIVRNALAGLFGSDHVIVEQTPSMTTEDFGAFLEQIPGSYWHIGVAAENTENYPLHNPRYAPDEGAVALAAAAHAAIVWNALCEQ